MCDAYNTNLELQIKYGTPDNKEIYTVDKGYTPKQGDCIFLMPGVNIPRIKLKDLALNLGVKIVRDPENANIVISGKSTLTKITTSQWAHTCDEETFTKYIETLDLDEYYQDKYETAINTLKPELIYTGYGTMHRIKNEGFNIGEGCSEIIYHICDEYKNMIDTIQSLPIYDESELLAMINGEDAVTITPEVYQQLVKMFQSSDQDNHIMAMEIMANSKYVESALFLLLLLEEYWQEIGGCHTRNHVNFKSMVSYFQMEVKNISSLSPDRIGLILKDYGLLTTEWFHTLLQERAEWFVRNINMSKLFNVKELVPTPEIEMVLDKPYVGLVEYKADSKEIASVSYNIILPEREIESEEEERIPDTLVVTEELSVEEIVDRFGEVLTEEQQELLEQHAAQFPVTEEEAVEPEPVSNNHQITQTNESTDIDWF